jgi:nucleoside-diphosphate-sugar epimerase
MKRILISGATGNIGVELVRYLYESKDKCEIIAAVRDVSKAERFFSPRLPRDCTFEDCKILRWSDIKSSDCKNSDLNSVALSGVEGFRY